MSASFLDLALARIEGVPTMAVAGRVTELTGLVLRATAPGARAGEAVVIEGEAGSLLAEVVGFRGDEVVLLPLGEVRGVGPGAAVRPTGRPLAIRCGEGLRGRVLDGLGRPVDGRPLDEPSLVEWPIDRPAPDALARRRVDRPLALGVRSIDALATVGEGQRIGLFAGAGVGKSTLLGQVARGAESDVAVVCLVGERGREVREFVEDCLGPAGLARSVVVVATSDAPPLVRLKAAFVATAIAEFFRDRGRRVLLLLDSLTRLARAQREAGLAAGEPPARHGYPPSVFALLPRLLERAGPGRAGTITGVYTVLVAGGDMEEPIADEARSILDGHVVLDRSLAERGHYPAVDILASLSRVMPQVTDPQHRTAATRLRALVAAYERQRDLILLGAYKPGSDPTTDRAIDRLPAIEAFLRQAPEERPPLADTRQRLLDLVRGA